MSFKLSKEYLVNIKEAVKKDDKDFLKAEFNEIYAADIAQVFDELETEEAIYLYSLLSKEEGAEVLMQMDEDTRESFLELISSQEIAEGLVDNLDSDDAADLLNELSDEKKSEVISKIRDSEQASDIVELLRYNEDSAGGLMAKELMKAKFDWNVFECLRELRKQAEKLEKVYTVYVVDNENILKGVLPLKNLLLVPTKTEIASIMNHDVIAVQASKHKEEVAALMEKYDLETLPVVDELGRLLGRITIDDVVDIIKEEAEKDYQLLSGVSSNVESSDNALTLVKARLPWILIGMLGGIVSSRVIGIYEAELQIHPEMALFIPLIAATGGNVGVQSSSLIVRAIANDDLSHLDLASKLLKEFTVGLMNALVCSGVVFLYNLIFSDSFALSLTVSIALMVVMIFAALFGTFFPLMLHRQKIDPALATGPFITTTNDIIGIFIYFIIGRLLYGVF